MIFQHHIPKLKHVSKMEYLDDRKEYEVQLKKQGKLHGHSTNDGYRDIGGHGNESGDGFHQALKFQFIDPGFMPHDNNLSAAYTIPTEEVTPSGNHSHSHLPDGSHGVSSNLEDGSNSTFVSAAASSALSAATMGDEVKISYSNKHQQHTMHSHSQSSCVSTTFSCHVWYPHQFRALRRRLYDGEDDFVESLSRCQSWNALGGKSGSTFQKTLDHRFVLKFVKQNEFKMFIGML